MHTQAQAGTHTHHTHLKQPDTRTDSDQSEFQSIKIHWLHSPFALFLRFFFRCCCCWTAVIFFFRSCLICLFVERREFYSSSINYEYKPNKKEQKRQRMKCPDHCVRSDRWFYMFICCGDGDSFWWFNINPSSRECVSVDLLLHRLRRCWWWSGSGDGKLSFFSAMHLEANTQT